MQLSVSSSQSPTSKSPTSLRPREHQSEPGPPARRGLHLNLSVVELDDAVDHRQADAAAFLFRREIEIEDLLQMLGGNADAGVLDVHFDAAVGRAAAADLQRPAVRHRLTDRKSVV